MVKPDISLIIPAYNEEKCIGRVLESIRAAKEAYRDPPSIEIIVVDNYSTDNTAQIADGFGVQIVSEKERRIAAVRNTGARIARGRIIGFLDADNTITPNMLNAIDRVMAAENYIGGGTMIKPDRFSLGLFCTYCVTVFPARWLMGIAGGLLFTEKATFEALGGFDESLYCAEDSKFAWDLKAYGKQRGKRFAVISGDFVTTSTRTFDRLGDWYYFKNIPRVLLKGGRNAFKDKGLVSKFWYDVER